MGKRGFNRVVCKGQVRKDWYNPFPISVIYISTVGSREGVKLNPILVLGAMRYVQFEDCEKDTVCQYNPCTGGLT
jgi:hypothetical protein